MGEQINKDFEDFQKELEEKEKKKRIRLVFEPDEKIDEELEELGEKEVVL
jgi:hypothetical protein